MSRSSLTLNFTADQIGSALSAQIEATNILPNDEQLGAARAMLTGSVTYIAGDMFCGKTQTIRLAIGAWQRLTETVGDERRRALAVAATGRGALNLARVLGPEVETSTLHRALGYDHRRSTWSRTPANPLPHGLVVLDDDAGLLDGASIRALLKASANAHVGIAHEPLSTRPRLDLPPVGTTSILSRAFRQPGEVPAHL